MRRKQIKRIVAFFSSSLMAVHLFVLQRLQSNNPKNEPFGQSTRACLWVPREGNGAREREREREREGEKKERSETHGRRAHACQSNLPLQALQAQVWCSSATNMLGRTPHSECPYAAEQESAYRVVDFDQPVHVRLDLATQMRSAVCDRCDNQSPETLRVRNGDGSRENYSSYCTAT